MNCFRSTALDRWNVLGEVGVEEGASAFSPEPRSSVDDNAGLVAAAALPVSRWPCRRWHLPVGKVPLLLWFLSLGDRSKRRNTVFGHPGLPLCRSSADCWSGRILVGGLVDVEAAYGVVDGFQDERPVLGEQVAVYVLGGLDPAVAHLVGDLVSGAPEAISSDAQTWRSSWAV